jgi:hypothetical protein
MRERRGCEARRRRDGDAAKTKDRSSLLFAGLFAQLVQAWTDIVREFGAEESEHVELLIENWLGNTPPKSITEFTAAPVRVDLSIAFY